MRCDKVGHRAEGRYSCSCEIEVVACITPLLDLDNWKVEVLVVVEEAAPVQGEGSSKLLWRKSSLLVAPSISWEPPSGLCGGAARGWSRS